MHLATPTGTYVTSFATHLRRMTHGHASDYARLHRGTRRAIDRGMTDAEIAAALKAQVSAETWARLAVQNREVLGLADDGVTVTLGTVWTRRDLKNTLTYLVAHPTPQSW